MDNLDILTLTPLEGGPTLHLKMKVNGILIDVFQDAEGWGIDEASLMRLTEGKGEISEA